MRQLQRSSPAGQAGRPIIVGSQELEPSRTRNPANRRPQQLARTPVDVSAPSMTTEANLPTVGLEADEDPRNGSMVSEVGTAPFVCSDTSESSNATCVVAASGSSALLSRPERGIYVGLYITQASTANACTINNATYSVWYGKRLIP